MEIHEEDSLFAELRPKNHSFQLQKAIIIIILVLCLILIYLIWSYKNWRKISISKVSNDDSLTTVIAKFRLSISKVYDTVEILKFLRKKIHSDKVILMNAVEANIIKYIFECIRNLSHDDQRVTAGIDVLNEIWASSEARAYFIHQANNGENICATGVPFYVDEFLELIQHLYKTKHFPSPQETEETNEPKSFFESMFDSSEVVDYSVYEYKLIMGLGLMSIDFPKVQSRVGDKGGLKVILESMQSHKNDVKICKWGCWSLVHLTFKHPPNKCEIVQRGGVPLAVQVLSTFKDSQDTVYQALALLFNLVSDDTRTKVNISNVRQMALTAGIVDEVQEIQKRYGKQNKGVVNLCQGILQSLVSEWS